MIKIEEVGTKVFDPEKDVGFAKDSNGDIWFFDEDRDNMVFFGERLPVINPNNLDWIISDNGPFTRLTGRIIISND